MSTYDASVRQQLRDALLVNNVAPSRVDVIVDLACHAADQAETALMAVIRSAADFGQGAMALEISLQLAQSRFGAIFDRTRSLGQEMGLPSYSAEVEIGL